MGASPCARPRRGWGCSIPTPESFGARLLTLVRGPGRALACQVSTPARQRGCGVAPDDLPTLARIGAAIARVLKRVPGAVDIKVDRVAGLPVLRAQVDRAAVAQRGANASDVLDAIETVGGYSVGTVLEGRRRFGLRVRLPEALRGDLEALRRLPIRTSGDSFAPLSDLASLEIVDEPLLINREATERRLFVQANVRGRDLGRFADEAQAAIVAKVPLPAGYHLVYGGQFENLRRARERLYFVVPLALLLICGLLFATFRALPPLLLILINVPFATTGGIFALAARGLPLSITAGVGFIALSRVAVLNGLVLITQILKLRAEGVAPLQAP